MLQELMYVLAEHGKVISFTPEEFDALVHAYRVTPEQRRELVEALIESMSKQTTLPS